MANTNIFAMTDSWNNAAVVFNAIQMDVADIASDPTSMLLNLKVGGASKFSVRKDGAVSAFSGYWDANFTTAWVVDATNVWAARNGVNPNALRVYNTFTDVSNYRRLVFDLSSTLATIRTEGAGTGVAGLPLDIRTSGANAITFSTSNSTRWQLDLSGNFGPFVDNIFDMGSAGSRIRNLYMGSWLRMASSTVATLPAAATAGANARMFVTDASAPAFGATVVGGGAVLTPVYSDGANWKVG